MKAIFTILFLYLFISCEGQVLLNKKISRFNVQDKSLSETLNLLSEKAGVRFSYKTDILQQEKQVYVSIENKSVEQILYLLFKDLYEYEEQQGYIIIRKRDSYYILSGYIEDSGNGAMIQGAIISTSTGIFSAGSDVKGYFQLKIPRQHACDYITVRKDFYSDAFTEVRATEDKEFSIALKAMKVTELAPVIAVSNLSNKKESKIAFSLLGNTRSKTTRFELGGLFNNNRHNARNIQLAGVINIVGGSLQGLQVAGLHNLVMDTAKGVQLAALVNKTDGPVKGVQIAAVNRAKKLSGLQIGIVNITDSSEGYSLGLLNLVRNKSGYHKLSLFASDLMNTNLSVKLGNAKLYTVFLAGMNISNNNKLHALGFGLGHDFIPGRMISLSTEVNYHFVNAGSWDNRLVQGKLYLNVKIARGLSLFAGTVYNRYTDNQGYYHSGYKRIIPLPVGTNLYKQTKNWVGWQVGITSSDLLWPVRKHHSYDQDESWLIEAGISPGVDFLGYKWLSGDIRLQKYLLNNMAVLLTTGINHSYENTQLKKFSSVYNTKIGLKIFTLKCFYVQGDIGITLNKTGETSATGTYPFYGTVYKRRFVWSPSFGWNIGPRMNISARYENVGNPIFLRVGCTLWRSRK